MTLIGDNGVIRRRKPSPKDPAVFTISAEGLAQKASDLSFQVEQLIADGRLDETLSPKVQIQFAVALEYMEREMTRWANLIRKCNGSEEPAL